ncbi:hypothetical protein A7K94_0204115 [Modestobacter sp. VKM Ac-2676]|nr:hypothetical protein A7K94_0204115 [Modestobacter sp. VKM Ac-2676]
MGGAMEQLALERSAAAVGLGAAVVVGKLVAAALGPALLRWHARSLRVLAVLAGLVLMGWGGANVLLGGAVLTGVLDLGPVADERALRWHVLLWDPWFLLWGAALLVVVAATRGQRGGAVDARWTSTGSTSSSRLTG